MQPTIPTAADTWIRFGRVLCRTKRRKVHTSESTCGALRSGCARQAFGDIDLACNLDGLSFKQCVEFPSGQPQPGPVLAGSRRGLGRRLPALLHCLRLESGRRGRKFLTRAGPWLAAPWGSASAGSSGDCGAAEVERTRGAHRPVHTTPTALGRPVRQETRR
jgi:hypothetical protein